MLKSNEKEHPPEEDDQSRPSELSDENIRRAVDNINNLAKRKEETQSDTTLALQPKSESKRKRFVRLN